MSEAKVENIDAIRAFRTALLKFMDAANTSIADSESEAVATLRWLEVDQRTYWSNAVRKSQELVSRCEEAVRHKRIFKDSAGRTPSAVDEEKALAKAKRMLEHAEERLENVRRYTPKLQREILLYKGQVQRLNTFVNGEIPAAVAKLDKITTTLQAYVNLAAPTDQAAAPMNLPADASEATSQAPPEQPPQEPP